MSWSKIKIVYVNRGEGVDEGESEGVGKGEGGGELST